MEEQKPTQGRIVLYKGLNGIVYTAIIAKVNEDGSIDICSFTGLPENPVFATQNVKQGEDDGCWDWLAFTKDQTKRLAQVNIRVNGTRFVSPMVTSPEAIRLLVGAPQFYKLFREENGGNHIAVETENTGEIKLEEGDNFAVKPVI